MSEETIGDVAAPGGPVSGERISWIIALDGDPIRRNLLITQCYHDLSSALAEALGPDNANWCTYATWASKTAGRFIRDDEIPAAFRGLLSSSQPLSVTLTRVNDALRQVQDVRELHEEGLLNMIRGVVHDVAEKIAAGNLAVFGELAPVFARAIEALAAMPGENANNAIIESLTPGPSNRAGQSLLASALRAYAQARAEPDPARRAALMLLANGQVGLHEQIRLQPFIQESLDAPIRDPVHDAAAELSEGLSRSLAHELHAIGSRLLHPVVDLACKLWDELATRELMKLELPDGTLTLGADLPAPHGQPLYPERLNPIVRPDVQAFLDQYGADQPGTPGTHAVDWATLSDRMRFILDMFRSRQCDGALLGEPFTPTQLHGMLTGGSVSGAL
ncbi:MAG: hypothetical protein QOF83_728 [Solirubrobacteraceae bacterium]|nr:hypothetical protein [Solirubrobacteraceae bacterium]